MINQHALVVQTPAPVMSDEFNTRAALRQRLLTVPDLPVGIAWENEGFDPTTGVPWLRETLLPVGSQVASFGGSGASDGLIRDDGLWQITVFWPAGQGTRLVDELVKAIASAFRPGLTGVLTYGGITVHCDRVRIAPALQEPDWYAKPITVSYHVTRPNT